MAVLLVLARMVDLRDLAKVVAWRCSAAWTLRPPGTVEFAIRFCRLRSRCLRRLAVGGISLQALAVGGGFTAIVVGLAAQQTLGNLFAGMVLLSARPFRLGERVRLQAGQLAGGVDGVVASLGLLYTTLSRGDERVMIPNTTRPVVDVVPLREPDPVDVKVTLNSGIRPLMCSRSSTPTSPCQRESAPSVLLEEVNGDSVVVRVQGDRLSASPMAHGWRTRSSPHWSASRDEHVAVDGGAPRS